MRPQALRLATVVAVTIACLADLTPGTASAAGLSANAHVFASGFNDPRGLHFGPDGTLRS
jgi:hypothetical protein